MTPRFGPILDELIERRFADFDGARISARLPIHERVINEAIARVLPAGAAVRSVRVQPREGNRFGIRIKPAGPRFLPPIRLTVTVERQADIPESPVLVLRLSALPGLIPAVGLGGGLSNSLPYGITLDGDRLRVDLRALVFRHGLGVLWPLVERAELTSSDGRAVLDVVLRVVTPTPSVPATESSAGS